MANIKKTLCISPQLLVLVQDHAESDYPSEACGFLIGHLRGDSMFVRDVVPAANIAAAEIRKKSYRIDPGQWLLTERRAAAQALNIIGIYHSHPDQVPMLSQTDMNALWPSLIYLIVSSGPGRKCPPLAWLLDDATGNPEACDIRLLE